MLGSENEASIADITKNKLDSHHWITRGQGNECGRTRLVPRRTSCETGSLWNAVTGVTFARPDGRVKDASLVSMLYSKVTMTY